MGRYVKLSALCATLVLHVIPLVPLHGAELVAGTARVDLTPPAEMKAALGGYGARMSRPAEGVRDQVFAKALVLSDGRRKYAVVTADILGFPPVFKAMLVAQLAEAGWTANQILLLPSHSHTSIDMNAINPVNVFGIKPIGVFDKRLTDWTLEQCALVIANAERALVPVTVGTSTKALAGWNRNRREAGGPVDDTLTVTRIDTIDGKPLAALVNYTAHPTFMGAEHMLFSGGWPGYLQRGLENRIGQGVNVLFYNGAEGDQSPIARPNAPTDRYEVAQQYGEGLADEAHEVWARTQTQRDVAFRFQLQKIDLPRRRGHPDFMKTGGAEYGLNETLLEKLLPLMFPATTASGSVQLGDLVIVGVPGEMTAELGLEVKRRAAKATGAQHVAIGGLANEWVSYILSAAQYAQGGYEASVSFYGAELGQCIVDGAIAGVEKLSSLD